jgi:hypothetical protein
MRTKITIFFLLLGMLIAPSQTASASARADAQNDQVVFDFPNTATFSATLTANSNITSVTLEYGDNQLTCGDVIAKAYPKITPGKSVQAEWTWDMRQSGSLPPGAQLWWRWRYTDESGAESVSEQKSATWLDDVHDWQTLTGDNLRVHWYDSDQAFGQTMLDAGVEGLRRNKDQAGLTTDTPVDLYVYPNYDDMKNAILYEPSWTGGMAFPEHNVVIMGISNSDTTWDQNTVIHELTHVLIGHFTFSCIGSVPTWLNEGLAMFSEGELDSGMKASLEQAINGNTLLTVRSLNGGFSELSDKANLSYSQSQSIVSFLISTYGQEKMTRLLGELRDAKPIDDALIDVYGFDTDGLEDAWRKAINAAPRSVSAQPTAQPTPTFVPTYVPVSGAPLAVTPTPYAIPTSSFDNSNNPPLETSPFSDSGFLILTIILLCACCLMLLVVGVFVLGLIVRNNNAKSKGENNA